MIIDTHAHLVTLGDLGKEAISSMREDGLEKIVNIGTNAKDSAEGIRLASENEDVFTTVGIHPEYASETTMEQLKEIDRLASGKKVVAVGEIGLDYHFRADNKAKQQEIFIEQIKIAHKHNLPICIHTRDAKEDTYKILLEHRDLLVLPSIMHCFSEDWQYAQKFMELGFYISFSGNITFKKSDRSFIKKIPLDRILVETDSPYLSPEPLRGRTNVPKNVKLTAQKLADEYEMSYEKFEKITTENAYRVFKGFKK